MPRSKISKSARERHSEGLAGPKLLLALNLGPGEKYFGCWLNFRGEVHQFIMGFSLEPRLRMQAINDMWALKETCREAFECTPSAASATQLQLSETLRHMGLSVEDESFQS